MNRFFAKLKARKNRWEIHISYVSEIRAVRIGIDMAKEVLKKTPHEQEVFPSSRWETVRMPMSKHRDLNCSFRALVREVYVGSFEKEKTAGQNEMSSDQTPNEVRKMEDFEAGSGTYMGIPNMTCDPTEVVSVPEDTAVGTVIDFASLPSIQAVRSDKSMLCIAYDCETQKISDVKRVITSWQFAFYPPDRDDLVVELVIFPIGGDKMSDWERITLRDALSTIFSLHYFNGVTVELTYSSTRRWKPRLIKKKLFDGDDEYSFLIPDEYKSIAEADKGAMEALANYSDGDISLLSIVDTSHSDKLNNFAEARKISYKVQFVCHSGIVDLSAFARDPYAFRGPKSLPAKSILEYVLSVQGGLVSQDPVFINVPLASQYWKFTPVHIVFRDTMCLAPQGGQSLASLGKSLGVPKIVLPDGVIEHMLEYRKEHFYDYLSYSAQDALITLMYGSKMLGINKSWIMTSTSGSATAMRKNLMISLGCENKKAFDRVYRGMMTVNHGLVSTPAGMRPQTSLEPINSKCAVLHLFSKNAYMGGYNGCFNVGLYQNHKTYDYDLKNAYPTAMCCVVDIDYDSERLFLSQDHDFELTLQDIPNPLMPYFAYVDFEFPKEVKFPCIGQHQGGSLVFTRTGKGVYATGPDLYLALKLGAKIFVHQCYRPIARIESDGKPSMVLRDAVKQLVSDRSIAQEAFGKHSVQADLLKLFVNGAYGKIAQDVVEKSTWSTWSKEMEALGMSSITCPERASYITAFVRAMLIGVMNELANMDYTIYSVTTDGFICDAPKEILDACEAYGIAPWFRQARSFLEDMSVDQVSCWVTKHTQTILLNIATRGNIGFGCYEDGKCKGVLAHNSYVSGEPKDSMADRIRTFKEVVQRTGKLNCVTTQFRNAKDIIKDIIRGDKNADFYTYKQERGLSMDFDMKRKPVEVSVRNVICDGIDDGTVKIDGRIEIANIDTIPFEDIEEYKRYHDLKNNTNCLRTVSQWEAFFLRVKNDGGGTRRVLVDLEWAKLMSIVIGYRQGVWLIPELDDCSTVDEKICVLNKHNKSEKTFTRNDWKNARRPERVRQMLPIDNLKDILREFHAQER